MDKSFKEKMIEYLTYHSHYNKHKDGPNRVSAFADAVIKDIKGGWVDHHDYVNDPPDPQIVPPEWKGMLFHLEGLELKRKELEEQDVSNLPVTQKLKEKRLQAIDKQIEDLKKNWT